MAERYYVTFPLARGEAVLQGPEAHHLAAVMRAAPGDAVCLFDGYGLEATAEVLSVGKKSVVLRVDSTHRPDRELNHELIVASALPKGDRGDFLVEKLTELGVTRFVPLKTRRSIVVPKVERLERTVIEASKQCGRNVLMEIDEVTEWSRFVSLAGLPERRLIAHQRVLPSPGFAGEGSGVRARVQTLTPDPSPAKPGEGRTSTVIAIGPEGGFTEEEVAVAIAAGWSAVSLGPRTLRIETAALALVAALSLA